LPIFLDFCHKNEMKFVLFQVRKLIRRIFALFGWNSFYFTSTGLKYINAKINYEEDEKLEKKTLVPDEVFLFIDGLKDKFTHLDKPIKKSPHYQLMSDLKNGFDIEKNIYIIHATKGTLDMRDETFYPQTLYTKRFKTQNRAIENNQVDPIKVLPLNGKYYILDGKHRAALLALLDKKIESLIIPNLSNIPLFKKTLWHIEKSELKEFGHHISILKEALKNNK